MTFLTKKCSKCENITPSHCMTCKLWFCHLHYYHNEHESVPYFIDRPDLTGIQHLDEKTFKLALTRIGLDELGSEEFMAEGATKPQ